MKTPKRPAARDYRAELIQTLEFTLARLNVVNEALRAGNLYDAGQAFAEMRLALHRQREHVG